MPMQIVGPQPQLLFCDCTFAKDTVIVGSSVRSREHLCSLACVGRVEYRLSYTTTAEVIVHGCS